MSEYIALTKDEGGFRLQIIGDPDPESPRTWDNLGVMFTPHRRYTLGDARTNLDEYALAERAMDRFRNWSTLARYLRIFVGATHVLPLGLLDHSGLHMYVGGGEHWQDPGGWDSGTIGVIFDTPRTREMCGTEPEQVEAALKGEVETYDQYLTGDVYGYVVSKLETCDHGDEHADEVDSCWGMFGYDYALSEGEAALASAISPTAGT